MLEFVKLFPTCFFFADIQPIKHALFLEYVGFKHFVKDLGVFSVDVLCWYGVKNIITLIVVIGVVDFVFWEWDPVEIVDEEAVVIWGHELNMENRNFNVKLNI